MGCWRWVNNRRRGETFCASILSFLKGDRRVGVTEGDAVLGLQAMAGKVSPSEPPHDRRTAKGIGELLGKRIPQMLIGFLRQIRDIHLWERESPSARSRRFRPRRTSPAALVV
jgi:hypothetical protein